jgi:TPR repeat protein
MSQNFPILTKIASQNYLAFKKSAENGSPYSQYNLGVCNLLGLAVPMNQEVGVYWFRKSAESGVLEAQFALGRCYHDGMGVGEPCNRIPYPYCPPGYGRIVKEHVLECVKLWTKAAEAGHIESQYSLGLLLQSSHYAAIDKPAGSIIVREYEQANKWFRKASLTGHKPSMSALAGNIHLGHGAERDVVEAIAYWIASGWEGQIGLYNYYSTMPGLSKHGDELYRARHRADEIMKGITPLPTHSDPLESKNKWRLFLNHECNHLVNEPIRSALNPLNINNFSPAPPNPSSGQTIDTKAMLDMALKLAHGDGVPKDEVEAYACLNICAAYNVRAKEELAALESRLSREEIAAGQRRTKEILNQSSHKNTDLN